MSQDFNNVKGNNSLFFIPKSKVPRGKKVTYARIVYCIHPKKTETHRVRITAGGNIVNCKGDPNNTMYSIEAIKMHSNSTLSIPGEKCCTADLKDFFLMAALEENEHLRIHMSLMPTEFMNNVS